MIEEYRKDMAGIMDSTGVLDSTQKLERYVCRKLGTVGGLTAAVLAGAVLIVQFIA